MDAEISGGFGIRINANPNFESVSSPCPTRSRAAHSEFTRYRLVFEALLVRLAGLAAVVRGRIVPVNDRIQCTEHFAEPLAKIIEAVQEIGGEGVVAKGLDAPYEVGPEKRIMVQGAPQRRTAVCDWGIHTGKQRG